MGRFDDKTFLVTGASSGIGRATSVRLAREGGRLILIARDQNRLEETRAMTEPRDHMIYTCDMTDDAAITEMLKSLREQSITLEGVVHCSGIHWLKPLTVTNAEGLQIMLASHVMSSIGLTRALIMQRLPSKAGCSIIWLSSVAAMRGGAGTVEYAAAKGAQISAARVLAVELAKRKIRVNVIAPGLVRTPQSDAYLSKMTP